MRIERFGELNARICGGADGAGGGRGPVLVLMHGFGAPGDDLVALARVLSVPSEVRFVFPEAPLLLDNWGSRAWWMIDPELFERRARGEKVDRRDELPPELPRVRAQLERLLEGVREQLGVTDSALILGGFSQGSMLALDVALHAERKPAALVLLSTTLLARSVWGPRMASCGGVPVFQSHGTHDALLPSGAAEELAGLLRAAGAQVEFCAFPGGHEIPPAVLAQLATFLDELTRR